MTVEAVKTPVGAENTLFRRGLTLGLTLAEVCLLIVFVLMLVFGGLLKKAQADLEQQQALKQEAKAARSQLRTLVGQYAPNASGQQVEQWVDQLVEASVRDADNRELREQLASAEGALKRIAQAAEVSGLAKPEHEASQGERWDQVATDIERAAGAMKAGQDTARDLASGTQGEVAKTAAQVRLENQQLRGAVANAQRKLEAAGKGTERPACWATADGRPEYIFEINLSAAGIRIRDRKLPHRRAQQAILPINLIQFDRPLSAKVFRLQTRPLFDWGESRGCRFFVIAIDGTGPAEKAAFKQRLREMEEHFYKYLAN